MVDVIDSEFMVCSDCYMVIGAGVYDDLDDERLADIEDGIAAVDGEIVPNEYETTEEFSTMPCECCGSPLAGARHQCSILSY